MNDPIADMLTRIRNAQAVLSETVEMPYSDFKYRIAKILEKQNFITQAKKIATENGSYVTTENELDKNSKNKKQEKSDIPDNKDVKIIIVLKYKNKLPAIRELKRISKLGKRVYVKAKNIKLIKRGYGFLVLSTSEGVMDSKSAKKKNIGGEILCEIS